MKRVCFGGMMLVGMILFGRVLAASWEWNAFDMVTSGNGYFLSWNPALVLGDDRLTWMVGYGQAFSDQAGFVDTLLYGGEVGWETASWYVRVGGGKLFLPFFWGMFGSELGGYAALGWKFGEDFVVEERAFWGSMMTPLNTNTMGYSLLSFRGRSDLALNDALQYVLGVGFWGETLTNVDYSLEFRVRGTYFEKMLVGEAVTAYGTTKNDMVSYDVRYTMTGFQGKSGTNNWYSSVLLEGRIFPLREVLIPFLSEGLYAGVWTTAGVYLDTQETLEKSSSFVIAGLSAGLLVSEVNMRLTYGYMPEKGWLFHFSMAWERLF